MLEAEGVGGGVSGSGIAGPELLRATLGRGAPRLRFPSVLGMPPTPQASTDNGRGGGEAGLPPKRGLIIYL